MPRLLIVDDDRALAAMLSEFLQLQGFELDVVHDGEAALQRMGESAADLVVLDVMLPGISGFEVLARLRRTSSVPVVMLTARGEESERIAGLMGGADDYLPKPFNPLELVARIRAVLKRVAGNPAAERAPEHLVEVGALRLDLRRCEVQAHGSPVAVTPAEMRVLEQLMRHKGEVLSRAALTEKALHRAIEPYDRSIDTLVSNLRRKLAAAGLASPCIRGLRGHGYVLDESTTGE